MSLTDEEAVALVIEKAKEAVNVLEKDVDILLDAMRKAINSLAVVFSILETTTLHKRPPRCIGAPCVVYLKRARPCYRSNC
jgi:hypothetical protein